VLEPRKTRILIEIGKNEFDAVAHFMKSRIRVLTKGPK
jgi:hypothetical protein